MDGVLARGTLAIPAAIKAMKHLVDDKGEMKVPVSYVTNALNRNQDKANQISNWFDIQVSPEQLIQAPTPLKIFKHIHDKHCLILGQGKLKDIAEEYPFFKSNWHTHGNTDTFMHTFTKAQRYTHIETTLTNTHTLTHPHSRMHEHTDIETINMLYCLLNVESMMK